MTVFDVNKLRTEAARNTPEWLATRNLLLSQWQNAEAIYQRAKADELALRQKFIEFAFPENSSGTHTLVLDGGAVVRCKKRQYFNFIAAQGFASVSDTVQYALLRIGELGERQRFIAERLVKWCPELQVGEYNKLQNPEIKSIIDEILEVKQGQANLELVPPKGTII